MNRVGDLADALDMLEHDRGIDAERRIEVVEGEASDRIVLDDRPYVFSEPKFDATNPPGSLLANLHDPERKAYASTFSPEFMLDAYQDRDARLAAGPRELPGFAGDVDGKGFEVVLEAHASTVTNRGRRPAAGRANDTRHRGNGRPAE